MYESNFVDSLKSVSQRVVHGLLLFSLYNGDHKNIVMKHKLEVYQYSDDTQIYSHCNNESTKELQMKMSEYEDEIATWMGATRIKLNSEKIEMICFSSPSESEKNSELFCPCIRKKHHSIEIFKVLGNLYEEKPHSVNADLKNNTDAVYFHVKWKPSRYFWHWTPWRPFHQL